MQRARTIARADAHFFCFNTLRKACVYSLRSLLNHLRVRHNKQRARRVGEQWASNTQELTSIRMRTQAVSGTTPRAQAASRWAVCADPRFHAPATSIEARRRPLGGQDRCGRCPLRHQATGTPGSQAMSSAPSCDHERTLKINPYAVTKPVHGHDRRRLGPSELAATCRRSPTADGGEAVATLVVRAGVS